MIDNLLSVSFVFSLGVLYSIKAVNIFPIWLQISGHISGNMKIDKLILMLKHQNNINFCQYIIIFPNQVHENSPSELCLAIHILHFQFLFANTYNNSVWKLINHVFKWFQV